MIVFGLISRNSRYNLSTLLVLLVFAVVIPTSFAFSEETQSNQNPTTTDEATADGVQSILQLDREFIPYEQYPFPVVPHGTLWQLDAFPRMEIDTIVPDSSRRWLPAEVKERLDEVNALLEAGEGSAAISLLQNELLPFGISEQDIGNIYLAGKGGIPQDKEKGFEWTAKAAEKNPHLFQWLGRNTQGGQDMRMHYWSRGLSRGCYGCARPLLLAVRKETIGEGRRAITVQSKIVGPDLALRYALYATEIGDMDGPSLIGQVRGDAISARTRGAAQQASEETWAELDALEQHPYGAAWAASEKVYTGLIPGRILVVAKLIEDERYEDAINALIFNEARGRYHNDVVDALMERASPDFFNSQVTNTFALRMYTWGDMRHAAAASIITRDGLAQWRRINTWKLWQPPVHQKANNPTGYQNRQNRAANILQKAQSSPLTPVGITQAISADQAVAQATDCLSKAVNYPNPTAYGNARRINGCRRLVDEAWSVSSASDFGLLSDDGFAGLLQDISGGCPECRAAAVQRQNAQRQAEIQRRKDRLDRWDEGPGGRNTPVAQSDAEVMERAEARTDYILGDLDPVQRVAQGGLTTDEARTYVALDRFYAAYRARIQAVAAGENQVNRSACNIWSYAKLPMCQ